MLFFLKIEDQLVQAQDQLVYLCVGRGAAAIDEVYELQADFFKYAILCRELFFNFSSRIEIFLLGVQAFVRPTFKGNELQRHLTMIPEMLLIQKH